MNAGSARATSAKPPSIVNAMTRSPARKPEPSRRRADAARHLDTGDEGQRRLHLVLAAGQQQIGKADAGGRDLDDHACRVLGLVDLDQTKARRALETLNLLCAHLHSSIPVWPLMMPLSAPDQRTVGYAWIAPGG